jgi:hypothetical protein
VASVEFTLRETYGNPPMPGGGYFIGSPGDTTEELAGYLSAKFGDRLASIRAGGVLFRYPLPEDSDNGR